MNLILFGSTRLKEGLPDSTSHVAGHISFVQCVCVNFSFEISGKSIYSIIGSLTRGAEGTIL